MRNRGMRILLVTRNLPPLVGGMERLNWHMAEELARIADVRIVGPEGSAALAPVGIEVREAPLKPLWKFLWRARSLARSEARCWKPDVVLAGSGLTAPIARSAARACGARTAVYVHGLDIAVRHPVYRALWLPAIRRADRVIANSSATAGLCRGIGINPARIGIVHPGVDLPSGIEEKPCSEVDPAHGPGMTIGANRHSGAYPQGPSPESSPAGEAEAKQRAFRKRLGIGDGPILLSVGRLSARKGVREFVTQALPRIITAQPDAMLVVVGDAPNQALHAEVQTPRSIREAAEAAGVANNIRFLGKVSDVELLALYGAADVHVFPVREIPGDPEGFGMVAVESAAQGLPTVAFATGGVVDAVADGESGCLITTGDYVAFADAVAATLVRRDALRSSCIEFAGRFNWSGFGAQIAQQLGLV